jgi:hypothetical protein
MRAVIFKTPNAVFKFDQKEVKEIIRCNSSKYDLDQIANLQDLISTECNETIVIPEEPVYFDSINNFHSMCGCNFGNFCYQFEDN